jgi:hypothetical protein
VKPPPEYALSKKGCHLSVPPAITASNRSKYFSTLFGV